ncbi:MAG: oligosaccharide flippase family protein [Thermoleophilaceae bacterium]|nr:oligosaccharide flippase family protein [Thermoleophilaceae bacterium]
MSDDGGGGSGARVSIARGTFIGLRADVATAVSALLMSVIVSRGLGPENRGVFFLALLVASMIALVGNLGLSTASIVFAATREISLAQLHGIAILLSTLAAAVGAAVLLGAEGFWTSEVLKGLDTVTIVLLCLGIAPTLYAQISQALLTGLGRIPYVSAVRVAVAIANPLVLAPVVIVTNDPQWAVGAWLAVMAGNALALAVYLWLRVGRPLRPRWSVLREVVSFGIRGYVGTVAHQGFLRVDVFFISARSGPGLVGIYSLASVFAEQISLLGKAVYGASARSIGELDRESSAQLTARIVRLLVALMVPVAVVAGLLAEPLFPLVFGEDFDQAALPFVLLLPGTICLALWYVVGLYIVSSLRRPGTTTLIQGGALLASLPLYYFAIKAWEMTGGAIVSSATYVSVLACGVAVLVANSGVRVRQLVPGPADLRSLAQFGRTAIGRQSG